MEIFTNGAWLPLSFAVLMGLSMLIYAILDGYDLGVGMLMQFASPEEQDRMIGSIGPFWDANETWLVLGVGLLLVAFPLAHGVILTSLYLPVAVMLIGLILRGVAFDFRAKAKTHLKKRWNTAFIIGSLIASVAQGYMLGSYILGFKVGLAAVAFSLLIGLCVAAAYSLVGACWLILKTEHALQRRAVTWARYSLWGSIFAITMVSMATPLLSTRIFDKWFSVPNVWYLLPIPLLTAVLIGLLAKLLSQLPRANDALCWAPFAITIGIFILCFLGLAYSFYPYIVPDQLLITEAASSPESLKIILVGAVIVLPVLFAYTFVAYRIFHGKATDLSYD